MTEAQFCFAHKTSYNSVNVMMICCKTGTDIGLCTTKTCSKFQWNQNVCLQVIAIFAKCAKSQRKMKKFLRKFAQQIWNVSSPAWRLTPL